MARRSASPAVAAPTGRGRSAADVLIEILATNPATTAAELTQLTGLGQSTVTKNLALLERDGLARREAPADRGGRRPAAHWQLATTPVTAPEPDNGTTTTTPAPSTAPASRAATTPSTGTRLGKGELGTLVLEYLIAHPGEDLGPTAIGKALTRSQGAIANCLTKLAGSGDIVQTSEQPRRYRLAH